MATQTGWTTSHTPSTPTRPQPPAQASGLKVKTHVKAGSIIVEDFNPQPDPPGVARK